MSRAQGFMRAASLPLPSMLSLLLSPVMASITEPIVNFATGVVDDLGLAGIFVLMFFESACIPIPSEATMLFAGFNVSKGSYSLLEVTLIGSVANLMGSWLAYGVGYYGRIELVERHGHKVHISAKHIAWADSWFERYGEATVFFARMLPIVRTFISLPAGVARMPFWRFSLYTFLGCIPWVFGLALIGKEAGDNWTQWKDYLHYVDYIVLALIVIAAIYLIVRRLRRPHSDPASDDGL